jgi:hypothetical protein
MKVDLPSGNWAELRDKLKGGDRMAAMEAVRVEVADGKTTVDGSVEARVCNALLARLITAWSFEGVPPPATHINPVTVLEDLDLDDYNALCEAIEPYVEKVTPRPNRRPARS